MSRRVFILFILLFINNLFCYSQLISIELNWGYDSLRQDGSVFPIPENFIFDKKSPKVFSIRKISNNIKILIKEVTYEHFNENDIQFIKDNKIEVDSVFSYNLSNVFENEIRFCNTQFSCIVYKNNFIQKVKKIVFEIQNDNSLSFKKRNLITNSVLSDESSKWFRFRVDKQGFYKITFNQLKELGVDPSSLGFSSFHIYGNSTGKLQELNSSYLDLDLVQNSVLYEGAEDGAFNENDAIVFYTSGPNKYDYLKKDSLFKRDLNIYSNYSSYFLRISNSTKIKSVNYIDNSFVSESNIIDSFLEYEIHEREDTSLVFAGKRWYGELLDYEKSVQISFKKFQQKTTNLSLSISGATDARQTGSYINIYTDNIYIGKIDLPSVSSEYIRIDKLFKIQNSLGFNNVKIELVRNNPSVKFFLDKIEINGYSGINIEYLDGFLSNPRFINKGNLKYIFNKKIDYQVMDVSNPTELINIKLNSENDKSFFYDTMSNLKKYSFYNYQSANSVVSAFYPIKSQNLHAVDLIDMIIVTPIEFLQKANELKTIHENEGLRVFVAIDQEIYNEFSSGEMDPTAIKQFARNVYNKQRFNASKRLKYLLLFGDGTFDYKNRIKGNNNFIPTYQFDDSEDFLSAMVSDDYYGMMDDNESINGSDLLDIGVGRMLISTVEQADQMISKIKAYMSINTKQTDWRSKVVLVTDDEEGGYFINNDTEPQSKFLKQSHPEMNIVKLYSDAFQQITTAGGERFPMVNKQIDNQFHNGALVISYVGHGGPSGAAEERILSIDQISNYTNLSNLPLFMSSTCEFTKYDDPTRVSAGEVMYLNPKGGAIALMTTTRPVFFGVNTISGNAFYKNVLQIDSSTNSSLTFGEIFRRTKNQSGTSSNRRSFTLIGDPALKINYPTNNVVIDSINHISLIEFTDTLKALDKVILSGRLEDKKGQLIKEDGNAFISFYDKSTKSKTLGQNVDSPIIDFENQNSFLFKGLASVNNGRFEVEFILPKDINYSYGNGKISSLSYLETKVGIGHNSSFIIGGISSKSEKDSLGPEIELSLDSSKVIENGFFGKNPIMYVKLKDESGINVSNSGIGHQISLTIDDDITNMIDLNSYYVADKDSYKSGSIIYPLTNLSDGKHKIKVKSWDVHNNSSEKEIQFLISNQKETSINRIFNYPNPFTNKTVFYIEHNNSTINADLKLTVHTISGKLVKELYKENIELRTNLDQVFEWDAKDQFGDQLSKGVYIYQISIVLPDGKLSSKIEKLVIF